MLLLRFCAIAVLLCEQSAYAITPSGAQNKSTSSFPKNISSFLKLSGVCGVFMSGE
jgi:hypothetical protein